MRGTWIRKPQLNTTVIFVHGILSNAKECWSNKNGIFWPDLLRDEEKLPIKDFGIYQFTYKTEVFSRDYSLSDVADALGEQLTLENLLYARSKLIFVCHSMGGIVVRKFIVDQQLNLFSKNMEIGLFLVASPSLGSKYANWLAPFIGITKNQQANALKLVEKNPWLEELDKSFKRLIRTDYLSINGKELIEDLPMKIGLFNVKPVPRISGAVYFREEMTVPSSDHSTIAKPSCNTDFQHRMLCNFITQELQKISKSKNTIKYHGTKYQVPGEDVWWNSLLTGANKRFFLVGQTNKSWFKSDDNQKHLLAKHIIRILNNSGQIFILSINNEDTKDFTAKFIKNYVLPKANGNMLQLNKSPILFGEEPSITAKLIYCVTNYTNYNAVVSDDKFILMPNLNSREFKDSCMVIEVDSIDANVPFKTYISDVERKFEGESEFILGYEFIKSKDV